MVNLYILGVEREGEKGALVGIVWGHKKEGGRVWGDTKH